MKRKPSPLKTALVKTALAAAALGLAAAAPPAGAAAAPAAACPAGKTPVGLPDGQTLCVALPGAAVADAPSVSDFGPVAISPGEFARLAVKNARADAAAASPPACRAALSLALPGLAPRTAAFTLRPGDRRLLDNYFDAAPARLAASPPAELYLEALATVGPAQGAPRCAERVTLKLEILDYKTGRLLRSFDPSVQRQASAN